MRDRTLTISSTGKLFAMTGWKIGWTTGRAEMLAAVQSTYQYLTFCMSRPLQVPMGQALLQLTPEYETTLIREYREHRTLLTDVLRACQFQIRVPRRAYFMVADYSAIATTDDRSFALNPLNRSRVAAIQMSVFLSPGCPALRTDASDGFCKQVDTLWTAAARLHAARLERRR